VFCFSFVSESATGFTWKKQESQLSQTDSPVRPCSRVWQRSADQKQRPRQSKLYDSSTDSLPPIKNNNNNHGLSNPPILWHPRRSPELCLLTCNYVCNLSKIQRQMSLQHFRLFASTSPLPLWPSAAAILWQLVFIGGATPKFLGGPNMRPTTDVLQAIYGL